MLTSKRLIFIFFSIAILLIFANILFNSETSSTAISSRDEVAGYIIDSIFVSTLHEFSLSSNNIKKRKSPYKKLDSLKFSYTITLPSDLPVVSILYYLKQNFKDNEIEIFCREKKLNADSEIEIKAGNNIKLFAELVISKTEFREFGSFSICLTGFENLEYEKKKTLILNADPYTFILSPSQKSADVVKEISAANKRFILLLNDDSVDDNFQLKTNFSKQRLLISIKNIAANFRNNSNLLIDSNSELYRSLNSLYIEKEFRKRGFKINAMNNFHRLDLMSDDQMMNSFYERIQSLGKSDSVVFVVKGELYSNLLETISKFKKRGFRYMAHEL